MRAGRPIALLVCALTMTTGGIAACGGGDDEEGGGGGATRDGGSITIAQTSQPDYMDPAMSYTVNGWEPMWLVYTPLLTYRRAEGEAGTELIPGLAEAMPEISEDGLTYELTLRKGLTFSDGQPVKASDFEHTIKRVLNLESGGSPFYQVIEGAEEYLTAGKSEADIPGIETDDKTGKITIRLARPDGTFSNVLAMNFAGVVPGDTPFKVLNTDPPPGVGPFKISESVPNRQFVLERNDRFDIPEIPKAHLDRITTEIVKSPQRQAQDVIGGRLDYMQDPPPADLKPEIKARYSDRYEEYVTVSTYYFWMNTREPPFDDPKVREAVNLGVDKPALARLFAGELQVGCSFLPPGMAGYDQSLDEDCPWGDPSEPPDLERARALVREAGAEGTKVTVWGNNDLPSQPVTEAYADMLSKMGFKAEPKIIDGGIFFQTVGNQRTRAQTGFGNWFQDFPHPSNFMFLVDGDTIQPTNNQNFGNVDVPELNDAIDRLAAEPELTDEVAEGWREANRTLVDGAWVVPYGYRKLATFMSERMDFENCTRVHPVYQNDYSSWCLK